MKNGLYRVEGEHIVSEEIDGETLVINYDTGTYYSFLGPSSLVWKLIGERVGVPGMLEALSNGYAAEAGVIERSLLEFLPKLREAGLIAADEGAGGGVPPAPAAPHDKAPFTPLEFKTFTDLQDLLVLDPIHDVDQTGWPAAPIETGGKGG